jgi:pimeloyl-ACP methyl ester carboxylesterase
MMIECKLERKKMGFLLVCIVVALAHAFQPTITQHNRIHVATRLFATESDVRFLSPLLEYGYRPTVDEYENQTLAEKPLLLYLPGFDGTFLCPFLQFPELGTVFDVRCMSVGMSDRSTFDDLKETVINYLEAESSIDANASSQERGLFGALFSNMTNSQLRKRPVYLAGESFGGMLAAEVALSLCQNSTVSLKGLCMINAATCYDRSKLAAEGPVVADLASWLYPVGLLKLTELLTDQYSIEQLWLILQAKALPSIIDTPAREAYMGRGELVL